MAPQAPSVRQCRLLATRHTQRPSDTFGDRFKGDKLTKQQIVSDWRRRRKFVHCVCAAAVAGRNSGCEKVFEVRPSSLRPSFIHRHQVSLSAANSHTRLVTGTPAMLLSLLSPLGPAVAHENYWKDMEEKLTALLFSDLLAARLHLCGCRCFRLCVGVCVGVCPGCRRPSPPRVTVANVQSGVSLFAVLLVNLSPRRREWTTGRVDASIRELLFVRRLQDLWPTQQAHSSTLINSSADVPGKNTSGSRPRSSWHPRCRTRRSSWAPKTA